MELILRKNTWKCPLIVIGKKSQLVEKYDYVFHLLGEFNFDGRHVAGFTL